MGIAPGTRPADDPDEDIVTVENVTRYWHGAAPAFDRELDPDAAGLGRSAEEIRAWELHFRRVLGPPPCRVLDVGTGAGSLSLLLASLGYQVTACDAVERMLQFAATNAERAGLQVELHRALADDLPFDDGAFDAVTSKLVLWTLLEPERAVTEWMRVTGPGGRILAIDGWNVPPRAVLERARIRLNLGLFQLRGGQRRSHRAQLPLGEVGSIEAYRNVFVRAGLDRVLVEELRGIQVLTSRQRSLATRLVAPVYPQHLIEGRVPGR